jgi:hypothetical protein
MAFGSFSLTLAELEREAGRDMEHVKSRRVK